MHFSLPFICLATLAQVGTASEWGAAASEIKSVGRDVHSHIHQHESQATSSRDKDHDDDHDKDHDDDHDKDHDDDHDKDHDDDHDKDHDDDDDDDDDDDHSHTHDHDHDHTHAHDHDHDHTHDHDHDHTHTHDHGHIHAWISDAKSDVAAKETGVGSFVHGLRSTLTEDVSKATSDIDDHLKSLTSRGGKLTTVLERSGSLMHTVLGVVSSDAGKLIHGKKGSSSSSAGSSSSADSSSSAGGSGKAFVAPVGAIIGAAAVALL